MGVGVGGGGGGLLVISVVEVSVVLGCYLVFLLSRLDLHTVLQKIFIVVVWSRLLTLHVLSWLGGIRLVLLGSRVLNQGWSMRCRCLQISFHHRCSQSLYLCGVTDTYCSPQ